MKKFGFVLLSLALTACTPVQPLAVVPSPSPVTPTAAPTPTPTPTETPTAAPTVIPTAMPTATPQAVQAVNLAPVQGLADVSAVFAVDDEGAVYHVDDATRQFKRKRTDGTSEVLGTFPAEPGQENAPVPVGIGRIERGGNGRTFFDAGSRLWMVDGSGKREQWATGVDDMAAGPRGEAFTVVVPAAPPRGYWDMSPTLRPADPPVTVSKLESAGASPSWTTKVDLGGWQSSTRLIGLPDGGVMAVAGDLNAAVRLTADGKVAATLDLSGITGRSARYGLLCTLDPYYQPPVFDSAWSVSGLASDGKGGFYVASTYRSGGSGWDLGYSLASTLSTSCGSSRSATYSTSLWHVDAAGKTTRLTSASDFKGMASTPRGELYLSTDRGLFHVAKEN